MKFVPYFSTNTYKVLGVSRVQYTRKDGGNVSGYRIYVAAPARGVDGFAATDYYCSDSVFTGLSQGDECMILFDNRGFVSKIEKVK